jgi:hypothetical protein
LGGLEFVSEAWDVVNHCRRILKWTYVAAYFAFATDPRDGSDPSVTLFSDKTSASQRRAYKAFFDFSNQEAENALERLSDKVETELLDFIPGKASKAKKKLKSDSETQARKDFENFRNEVIGLSGVTRSAFEKMTLFLENGLDRSIQSFI